MSQLTRMNDILLCCCRQSPPSDDEAGEKEKKKTKPITHRRLVVAAGSWSSEGYGRRLDIFHVMQQMNKGRRRNTAYKHGQKKKEKKKKTKQENVALRMESSHHRPLGAAGVNYQIEKSSSGISSVVKNVQQC
jgi:hypothetical protein